MRGAVVLAVLSALIFAGCQPSANPNTPEGRKQIVKEAEETAATRAKQGDPCEAAKIDTPLEGEPSTAERKYSEECTRQKNDEAREKEAAREKEGEREAERLKSEGR